MAAGNFMRKFLAAVAADAGYQRGNMPRGVGAAFPKMGWEDTFEMKVRSNRVDVVEKRDFATCCGVNLAVSAFFLPFRLFLGLSVLAEKSERPAFQRARFRGIGRGSQGTFVGSCATAPQDWNGRDTYNQEGWLMPEVASGVVGIDAGGCGKLAGILKNFGTSGYC
jgi:hypothetical protein